MGDAWDYRLRKMEIAWELASRLMPAHVKDSGRWSEDTYLKYAQETMRQANDIVETVFPQGVGSPEIRGRG